MEKLHLASRDCLDVREKVVEAVSMTQDSSRKAKVNVRRAEVMELVEKEIQKHYQSELITHIRNANNKYNLGHTEFFLAREFGFCNGVRRAIDIAYAARRVFADHRIFLIGDIIHNPEVNQQLAGMGIKKLPWKQLDESYNSLTENDVVIVPAFGVPTFFMDSLEAKGVQVVDTTCGDVMKVWKRVKNYAAMGVTSIIHGKATHEETSATASRARGDKGRGKYLVVYNLDEAQKVCDYILGRGNKEEFLAYFKGAYSEGFDPDEDLEEVGIANQTTMLKTETQQLQKLIKDAIVERDGDDDNFFVFDTICGATQARQDALYELLEQPIDVMFVVGGYNSSNTTHLVDIAKRHVTTYFIESAECIKSLQQVEAYDTDTNEIKLMNTEPVVQNLGKSLKVGITAGASCPANLIEATILRISDLRK